MDLPKLTKLDVSGKRVLLRLDLDTSPDPNDLRIKASEETLNYLKEKGAEIIILAHRGRPDGKVDEGLSLAPFQPIFDKWRAKVEENLRFDAGEEKNDLEYAKKLASLGDVYVNEAFGSSHREHASIVGLPKLLPHAAGFHFSKEIENLRRVMENPERPVVIIISGIKKDKVNMIGPLSEIADKVLVGGRLPEFLGDSALESVRSQNGKVIIGNLVMDKEDITLNTIDRFIKEIKLAKTIVLAGVLGKYEDEGHRMGTEKVFSAVADSNTFKIVGGGDSLEAVRIYHLEDKFSWISVGGGAMLEFLSKKTLPGIEAMKNG
ncbi:MAG: Phosphoglycerate kinase [Candidatus Woesebacteria bacterium GW2011_GWA2_40_7]|uniref:phosphoglycerate kinase n=3 Tax=Candidatus Woeseibacteriota TaxID=1752722 RepID=A0A0G0UXK2_9BACT|nr:MAG: Phosphoglycerate kinase [Candidatus Woesebacteria bacterium GW2011_GWB1_39_10]KKR72744.1 MAG: Phosphoglycerate kinase [Candidatus Woesebacteria bacterium GW2011_GWA2_40_7]KKR92216.1 MAG: Phosphoglycerate kinase [Candidatus Woesebacteria bacterium GW2011_GWA1_41_13b]